MVVWTSSSFKKISKFSKKIKIFKTKTKFSKKNQNFQKKSKFSKKKYATWDEQVEKAKGGLDVVELNP